MTTDVMDMLNGKATMVTMSLEDSVARDVKIEKLEEENKRLREALENIKIHQQMIGGKDCFKGGAWVIADNALGEE